MFLGINMFWARRRVILTLTKQLGLKNNSESSPKHIYAKNINSIV